MKHVLITGGAGFIGSHLAEGLIARGDRVVVLDNLSTGNRANVPQGAVLVEGDVTDPSTVDRVVGSEPFDAVLHVAGQASVAQSFTSPERDLSINVLGTLNVLEGCLHAGIPRLVHASSMTVYGEPEVVPTPESHRCIPTSFYAVTKYAAERYVQISGERRDAGLSVCSLRMFNVYGERQSLSNPYQGVLAIFIANVLRGEPITIHSDGQQTRDFVYVPDVVDAWLAVLDEPATSGHVFNVGSGRETSINEIADTVLEAFRHSRESWPIQSIPAQEGDIRRSAADISRLRDAVGWEPRMSFEEGCRRTVRWAIRATLGVAP